jgi:hypothetical protein
MRQAAQRGEALGLNDDEVAFYDALETNDSAVKVLGDDALRTIARGTRPEKDHYMSRIRIMALAAAASIAASAASAQESIKIGLI